MNHLQQTASAAALLYARAPRASLRETAGDLLRAVTSADRAIEARSPDALDLVRLVRDLALAAVGGGWLRESDAGRQAALRLEADLRATAEDQAGRFDRTCAAMLGARFPAETAATAA